MLLVANLLDAVSKLLRNTYGSLPLIFACYSFAHYIYLLCLLYSLILFCRVGSKIIIRGSAFTLLGNSCL